MTGRIYFFHVLVPQKTHEGASFVRVISPALDPVLVHWAATELVVTYSPARDSLQLDLVTYNTRLVERTHVRQGKGQNNQQFIYLLIIPELIKFSSSKVFTFEQSFLKYRKLS